MNPYFAQVASSMNATPREDGGEIAAPQLISLPPGQGAGPGEIGPQPGLGYGVLSDQPPPVAVALPQPVTTIRMSPEEKRQADAFMATPINYGAQVANGAQIFGTPVAPAPTGPNIFAGEDPTKALERGGLQLPREGQSTDFQHGAEPSWLQQVGNAVNGPPPPPEDPRYVMRPGSGMGGVIPAKETEMRGPTLLAAQTNANNAAGNAIQQIGDRGQIAAAADYEMMKRQADEAYARQDAANDAAAQREQELQARQADFDSSVKQLSQASLDPDRFWASRSTPQKISGLIAITLGGFTQGVHGGSNPGLDIINQAIDRDLKAQEFAYNAAKDTATAKQTAFGMAMQKYGSLDAARAVARASALDAVQAQIGQAAALYKGTDAANRADLALAQLQRDKENQIAQGIAFQPARQVVAPRQFVDKNTGLIYSEAEMKGLLAKQGEYEHDLTKQELGQEGAIRTEVVKGALAKDGKADEGAKYISSELRASGIPEARAHAELARTALNAEPLTGAERFVPYAGINAGMPLAHKAVFGQRAAEREQAWKGFKAAAIRAMAGARGEGSPLIAQRMGEILDAAGDQQSRLAAIKQTQSVLDEQEKNIRAGASSSSQAQYDEQKGGAKSGGPQHLSTVTGFKPVK